MMLNEIEIDLHTPEGGQETMLVRVLGKSRFLCLASTDFFSSHRVLCGDTFEANLLTDRLHLLQKVIQPSDMLHFQADLGLYMLPNELSHNRDFGPKEKNKAFQTLRDHINDQFASPALNNFLAKCKGAWELDEFIQCYTLTIHIPRIHRELLFAALPDLCPGLRTDQLQEIHSGVFE